MVKNIFKYVLAPVLMLFLAVICKSEPISDFIGFAALILFVLFIILGIIFSIIADRDAKETGKTIKEILDESDEKLKRGEMTQEENDDIHFYYECEYPFVN